MDAEKGQALKGLLGEETANLFMTYHVNAPPEQIAAVLNDWRLESGDVLYVDYYPVSDAIMTRTNIVIWERGVFV